MEKWWRFAFWQVSAFCSFSLFADTVGFIAGPPQLAPAYGGFVTPGSAVVQTVDLSGHFETFSSSVNASGAGFVVGGGTPGWANFILQGNSAAELVNLTPGTAAIYSTSINELGQGLFGGSSALFFASSINLNAQDISGVFNAIYSVSLNNLGQGLVGGGPNYAAFVSEGNLSAQPISMGTILGPVTSVALNDLGQGLLGTGAGQAAFIAYGQSSLVPISVDPTVFSILTVAMNEGGEGLIGGGQALSSTAPGYAAFVSFNNPSPQVINLGVSSGNSIYSAAINDLGQGLVVGEGGYAAFVNAGSETASIINLGTSNRMYKAAINNFGQGLIGGVNYAAFVDANQPALAPFVISLPPGTVIDTMSLSSVIPLKEVDGSFLTANNLTFAKFINEKAPQKAFYFLPSVWQGSLEMALQSAAPTRNAANLFAADLNMFYLNHGLSSHLRNDRHFRQQQKALKELSVLVQGDFFFEKEALTARAEDLFLIAHDIPVEIYDPERGCYYPFPAKKQKSSEKAPVLKERTSNVWFEMFGVLAFQKTQHQTVGFDPSTAGAMLAFDSTFYPNTQLGFGVAYTFTDINQEKDSGSSFIHQGYVFAYASSWHKNFYFDAALWGCMFRMHQKRKIHLPPWNFESTSNPNGLQVAPHFEIGYDALNWAGLEKGFLVNPFAMFDWVVASQSRYQERGSGPFNAGQRAHTSSLLRSEAGLRFYEPIIFDLCKLLFEQKVSYVNRTPFGVGNVNAFLVGAPGSFTVETLTSSENLIAVEAAIIFDPLSNIYPYWSLSYQGEFEHSFQSHQLIFELSWQL